MKIKNLKYIFGIFIPLCLFCGILYGACVEYDGRPKGGGSVSQNPSSCVSNASQGDSWYDNHKPSDNEVDRFLAIIGKSWSDCSAGNVRAIQQVMQSIGGHCSTCVDGKAGNDTRTALHQCLQAENLCPGPDNEKPGFSNGVLTCSPGYITGNVGGFTCCKKATVTAPTIGATPNPYDPYNPSEISVTVNFTDNTIPPYMWGFGIYPQVQGGGDIIARNFTNYSKITFKIKQPFDTTSITITVPEGQLVYTGGIKSPVATKTINAKPCEKPLVGGNCDTYGTWYSENNNCCVLDCEHPQESPGVCGDGYIPDGECCAVDQCTNRPPEGATECEGGLILSGECCEPRESVCGGDNQIMPEEATNASDCTTCSGGTIPNEAHTKCVCDPNQKCCGIQLNTVVPFIGDCIEMDASSDRGDTTSVTSVTAFPVLMQGLMKILMSAIMVFSFLMIIVAGLMMTTGAFSGGNFKKGTTILKNVIISLILLGCSGLILSLINPSFFGG